MGGFKTFAAFFAKGLEDANDKEKFKAMAEKLPPHVHRRLIEGKRFRCSKEGAYG